MSRFARVVGEPRQREVIIFYQEDLAHVGHELAEIADEHGDLRPESTELGDLVTARSLAAFEVDETYARVGAD